MINKKIKLLNSSLKKTEKTLAGKIILLLGGGIILSLSTIGIHIFFLKNNPNPTNFLSIIYLTFFSLSIFALYLLIIREISLIAIDIFFKFCNKHLNQLIYFNFKFTIFYIINIILIILFGDKSITNFIINNIYWWLIASILLLIVNILNHFSKKEKNILNKWAQKNKLRTVLATMLSIILTAGVLTVLSLLSIIDIWQIIIKIKYIYSYLYISNF